MSQPEKQAGAGFKDVKYIGDGVSVGHDNYHIWLFTGHPAQCIALCPEVMSRLQKYVATVEEEIY